MRVASISNLIRVGGNTFSEDIHIVDSTFLDVFDFKMINGGRERILNRANNIVLSEDLATKYFGNENPLGKLLDVNLGDNFKSFTVAGIMENPPANSSIQYDALISFGNSRDIWSEDAHTSIFNIYVETYVLMNKGVNMEEVKEKTSVIFNRMLGENYAGTYELIYQPLTDIHLNQEFPQGLEPVSDPAYSYILSAIALLVLLIACINFVSLSLGKYLERVKEVGIRKVIGADRRQIVHQFWGEAFIVIFLSLAIGFILAELLMPVFNELSGKMLEFNFSLEIIAATLILLLVISFSAGFYPALYLSRFNPVQVLKGQLQGGDASLFRRVLVVVQFSLSSFLMISAFVMNQQLHFLQNKNLGFEKEQVVSLPTGLGNEEALALYGRFESELFGHQDVVNMSSAFFSLGEGWMFADYNTTNEEVHEMYVNIVDHNFIPTMRMELVAGRNFTEDITSDVKQAIIVNEALVKDFGWKDPVGKSLPGNFPQHQIIGVVKDFNFASLHTPVEPLTLALSNELSRGFSNVNLSASPQRKILVSLKAENLTATMKMLKNAWKKVAPGIPFNYYFLDEVLDAQYRQEARLGAIVKYATFFAIIIACLGLISLAGLMIRKRTKEIGVRKVLGASVLQIIILITKDFVRLVIIAILIASPIAYFIMDDWLQDFSFRIDIGIWPFLLVGVIAVTISWVTISFQSVKAASVNPVKSLKSE